ncbi:MAG: GDSL-type esterase/lipase family protein [candidate division KSB1 bacterium]|nr:GDSL-type esterase/lipase family protein [candidate division KSB1 bacterium]
MKKDIEPPDLQQIDAGGRNKRIAFTILVWLLPLFILGMVELGLRIAGYAGAPKLFISAPKPYSHLLRINPTIARRYFRSDRMIPTPSHDTFLKSKPENGLRIFVLGGSTTAGYPYDENARFSRILENALQAAEPARPIEVVNLAMSAINSYALLDMMDELLEQKPDLILIYAGHNEYYGALGVGSRESLGRNRGWVLTALKLRRSRLFMLTRSVVTRLRKVAEKPTTATLMERIVAEQQIPLDSPLYTAGIRQFEANLDAILKKAKRRGVPVVLSELVSNLADQPPFLSLPDHSAEQSFREAKAAEQAGDWQRAKSLYLQAKEQDALRFRAPETMNQVIRTAADRYRLPLVPMVRRFEAASPNGIIGGTLMIDHLHPNLQGYRLMAEAFLDVLLEQRLLPLSQRKSKIDDNACAFTAADSLYGELSVQELKSGWPFKPESRSQAAIDGFQPRNYMQEEVKKAIKYDNYTMRHVHAALAASYERNGDLEAALAEYRAYVAMHPLTHVPYLKAAELCNRLQRHELTPAILEPFLRMQQVPAAEMLLAQAYLALGDYDRAEIFFQRAQKEMSNDPVIQMGLAAVKRAKESRKGGTVSADAAGMVTSKIVAVSPQVASLMQQAQELLRKRSFQDAKPVLMRVVELENVPQAHMWLGQIYLDEGNFSAAIRHLETARKGMPKYPYLLYNLTIAYLENGETARAREIWRALQGDFPNFQDPYRLAERLSGATTAR